MSQNNQIEVNLFVYIFTQFWKWVSVANSPSCQVRSWGSGQSNVTLEPAQSTTIPGGVLVPKECCLLCNSLKIHTSWVLLPSLLSLGCRHSTDDSWHPCACPKSECFPHCMPSTQNYPLCKKGEFKTGPGRNTYQTKGTKKGVSMLFIKSHVLLCGGCWIVGLFLHWGIMKLTRFEFSTWNLVYKLQGVTTKLARNWTNHRISLDRDYSAIDWISSLPCYHVWSS